ncbi:uncharacterized protein LOC120845422 [Ixodes scapularis]|uniref:uncharacterized protein LOC120845422 n=1 Tax=Ixodes scapularis TaxID=6945 RepID=UPI001C390125|nr:uncharacterized protein LOC120845422 [Ixodes scapularis]
MSTCESAAPLLARIAERPESRLGQLLCVLGTSPAPRRRSLPSLRCTRTPTNSLSNFGSTGWALGEERPTSRQNSWRRTTSSDTTPAGQECTVHRRLRAAGRRFVDGGHLCGESGPRRGRAAHVPRHQLHHGVRGAPPRTAPGPPQKPRPGQLAGALRLPGGPGAAVRSRRGKSPRTKDRRGSPAPRQPWPPLGIAMAIHCGISGNERADALAKRIHDDPEFLASDVGPFADAKLLVARKAATNHADERYAAGDRPAKPPRNWDRPTAAVVHRIRTRCALTLARKHLLRPDADPECPTCGIWSDLDHLLLDCPKHADDRAAMTASFAALGQFCSTRDEVMRRRSNRRAKIEHSGPSLPSWRRQVFSGPYGPSATISTARQSTAR